MKKISLIISSVLLSALAFGQTDKVLLVVDGRPVTRSEFEGVYKKNNKEEVIIQEALEDYLKLYVNFRLKVRAAEIAGLDTSVAFRNELAGYRNQLAQPYLTDTEVTENLIREAYDRLKTDVRARHILITVAPNALPKDTLEAWNKIMGLRNQIVKEGKDFGTVAKAESQDPSAKDNSGDLGYFTSMMMVYPFENVAYSTPVGSVSMPVRTRFGYHIVKVEDRRDARGQVLAGHIMISTQNNTKPEDSVATRKRIFEIYDKVKAGESFEELARQYSDDRASAAKGGQLPWFGTGRMVPEFENQVYAIKENGGYSEPFQTRFGWHIVKKYDQKDIASFSEMKTEIKNKIARDSRSEKSKESFLNRLKKEYNYTHFPKNMKKVYKAVDTTYYSGNWTPSSFNKLKKPLFTLGDTTLYQADFGIYLQNNQVKQKAGDIKSTLDVHYSNWVNETVMKYENNRLEKKYPEFRALMQEYRDGILLFDLTDKMVWSKAVEDSAGLQTFYEANKSRFMWPERVYADIYTASSKKVADQTLKLLSPKSKKQYSNEEILKIVNKDSELNLRIDSDKFVRSEFPVEGFDDWKTGLSGVIQNGNQYYIVNVKELVAPQPKQLKEAKGLITASYQEYLEEQWINELKKKYSVEINREVLKEIK